MRKVRRVCSCAGEAEMTGAAEPENQNIKKSEYKT
jgi:hypothetical protein